MELATDIMAILGWGLFGVWITPILFKNMNSDELMIGTLFGGISFALIAASLVLE